MNDPISSNEWADKYPGGVTGWEIQEVQNHLDDIRLTVSGKHDAMVLFRVSPVAHRVMLSSLRLLKWAVENAPRVDDDAG